MLLRITIKNFLSIHGEQTFDMFPNSLLTRFHSHIIEDKVSLMKYAAIYGANSAGKSNFIKSFIFLQQFVTNDDFLKGQTSSDYKYALVSKNSDPIVITIEFKEAGSYYKYTFSWDTSISETLHLLDLDGHAEKELFRREADNISTQYITDNRLAHILLKQNPDASILSLNTKFPVMVQKDVTNAYKWFRETLRTVTTNSNIPNLILMMHNNRKMLDFASTVFNVVGICDKLDIKETLLSEWLQTKKGSRYQASAPSEVKKATIISANFNGREEFVIAQRDGVKYVYEFSFMQQGEDGLSYLMDFDAQSEGSVRLLTMIPCLYEIATKPVVYIVDEIEWSMHPLMVRTILRGFSGAKSFGQLIFSTHMPYLMNQQELLRLDEMWITEKTNGSTTMRTLNDFIIDEDMDVERAYLLGRFGGIPNIKGITVE